MATPTQVAELRGYINEPLNAEPYTDDVLSSIIDSAGTVRKAAKSVWESKAGSVAHLVNISEAGSSRSMGDIHKNFLIMAGRFDDEAEAEAAALEVAPRTRGIRRA